MKKAVTKAETEPLASIEVDDYTTSTLFVLENQDIPGHGHATVMVMVMAMVETMPVVVLVMLINRRFSCYLS